MPLVSDIMKTEFRKISDKSYSLFEGFPETMPDVASRWAKAVYNYANPVIPASTSGVLAKDAFEIIMLGLAYGSASITFQSAFTAFASALVVGMLPTFVATPPPVPIVLDPVFAAGFAGGSSEECANIFASIVNTWFKTGTAIPSGGGSLIFWN